MKCATFYIAPLRLINTPTPKLIELLAYRQASTILVLGNVTSADKKKNDK